MDNGYTSAATVLATSAHVYLDSRVKVGSWPACKYEEKVEEIGGPGPLPDVHPGEEHGEDGGGGGDHVDVGQGEVPQAVELADDAEAASDGARDKLQSHS